MASPSVTIFGPTGGSGFAVLKQCLAANLPTTVLVRTPSKLLDMLCLSTPPSNLNIVQGDIKDSATVKKALTSSSGHISDVVFSSIGITPPAFSLKTIINPFKDADTDICRGGTTVIVESIRELRKGGLKTDKEEAGTSSTASAKGPLLIVYSTTGISDLKRDIPVHMIPLYHWLLAVPHKDKKAMEEVVEAEKDLRYVIIRPSLLTGDGKTEVSRKDLDKIRIGIERGSKVEATEIGSVITREACGSWVFENVIVGSESSKYEGARVGVTW